MGVCFAHVLHTAHVNFAYIQYTAKTVHLYISTNEKQFQPQEESEMEECFILVREVCSTTVLSMTH